MKNSNGTIQVINSFVGSSRIFLLLLICVYLWLLVCYTIPFCHQHTSKSYNSESAREKYRQINEFKIFSYGLTSSRTTLSCLLCLWQVMSKSTFHNTQDIICFLLKSNKIITLHEIPLSQKIYSFNGFSRDPPILPDIDIK
jgi:hypothetical protein